jgi:hypothetical protein
MRMSGFNADGSLYQRGKTNLPGFTAEVSLYNPTRCSCAAQAHLHSDAAAYPAQSAIDLNLFGKEFEPRPWTHPTYLPKIIRYYLCWLRCYSSCIETQGPGHNNTCAWVANSCCTYGSHCSYCP